MDKAPIEASAPLSNLGAIRSLPLRWTMVFRTGFASISLLLGLSAQTAQPRQNRMSRPVEAESSSSISSARAADGSQFLEIRNVVYEVTGTDIPGRPSRDRLLLRKTTHSKETLGDIGVDATILLEAWRLGDDLRQTPVYTISSSGTDGHAMDNAIFVASRGLEEVDWWSVYRLGTGQHLFDSYVPVVSFSISKQFLITRYVGLEIPPDDTTDTRLKQPNVVAVLTYASAERVLREALVTSDDAEEAVELRSFADETRSIAMLEGEYTPRPNGKPREPSRTLRLAFSGNYPSASNTKQVLIPVEGDDLDLTRAQLPAKMHVSAWRR